MDRIPNRTSPLAILLRESYREGGRVKKRTLANLSKRLAAADRRHRLAVRRRRGDGQIAECRDGFRDRPFTAARPCFGGARHDQKARARPAARRAASFVDRRVRDLIEAMIMHKIVSLRSKLAFHRALAPETATSSLALAVGLADVARRATREVYDSLDWLVEQQSRIETALAKAHLVDGTLVLYDVSSSTMEGRCCPLAKHGYSRDHRPDRPQIVYGLLCAPDGTPIAIEVFEGNTSDPQTISKQIEKLKRRFKLSNVALVGATFATVGA